MKPYGQKPQMMVGKCKAHTSDTCGICSNKGWKISKRAERRRGRRAAQAPQAA